MPHRAWSHTAKLTEDEFKLWLDALEATDKFQNYLDNIAPRQQANYDKKVREIEDA